MDDALPGKFEITKEGLVHDLTSPNSPHELTRARLRRRLEKVMPEGIVAHTGVPDVEDEPEGILRRPDVIVIAEADMERDDTFGPRTLMAAIEVVSRSNPDNDWVTKMRDYPLTPTGSRRPELYECPNSAESSSAPTETDPESGAGRSGNGSTRVSSTTGGAGRGGFGMTAASEWPPQP